MIKNGVYERKLVNEMALVELLIPNFTALISMCV
jgi:hypothetical protein